MMVDPMPPPVIVLAKVSLVAPVARSVHPPRFVTTLRLSDGTSASKPWQATSSAGRSDYRAIFGLPKDVVLADTVLAPAP